MTLQREEREASYVCPPSRLNKREQFMEREREGERGERERERRFERVF